MTERELERFFAKADVTPDCWIWTACIAGEGYGYMTIASPEPGVRGRPTPAHRLAYEHFVGPIPEGLTLDHTCHNSDPACPGAAACLHRRCVNPAHLEAVTRGENVMRGQGFGAVNAAKTHCPQSHPYDEENTRLRPSTGHRHCRTCEREHNRKRYRENRQEILAARRRQYSERKVA